MDISGRSKYVFPFKAGSAIMVAGPTGCGKTRWVHKLLKTAGMFTENINSVLYCYKVFQTDYEEMADHFKTKIKFYEGLPTPDFLRYRSDKRKFDIVVLDDLMNSVLKDKETEELFTVHCHHFNITAIFISQNVFAQGRCARNISLNVHVLTLFANHRDKSQIFSLAKQLNPLCPRALLECFNDATKRDFGYLVVDCTPVDTPDEFRWRTNVFPSEDPKSPSHTVVYLINQSEV